MQYKPVKLNSRGNRVREYRKKLFEDAIARQKFHPQLAALAEAVEKLPRVPEPIVMKKGDNLAEIELRHCINSLMSLYPVSRQNMKIIRTKKITPAKHSIPEEKVIPREVEGPKIMSGNTSSDTMDTDEERELQIWPIGMIYKDPKQIEDIVNATREKLPGKGRDFNFDITPLLPLPQADAARAVNMSKPTFCKRWKEAAGNSRKWPHRQVHKIDKQILTLRKQMIADQNRNSTRQYSALLRLRKNLLAPIVIKL
eukprot:TRINITY_DN11529_c0_g1_i1.p1 TRINITY_DN11529_c0_g1~~TRINITY_DN11529_c0_g1_i1.p1  ORF type:complete len:255 (-),score=33.58 TRINITY_DN11529_c0_g1_i1:87-851(-)